MCGLWVHSAARNVADPVRPRKRPHVLVGPVGVEPTVDSYVCRIKSPMLSPLSYDPVRESFGSGAY